MRLSEITPRRALVVAPHADDEVLGAGGLIAAAAAGGWEVRVLYATVSGFRSAHRGDHASDDARLDEVRRALAALGGASHDVLFTGEEKHLRLDTVPQHEMIAWLEREANAFRPGLIATPCRGHYNQDHRALADACVAAFRPAPGGLKHFAPVVLAYGHSAAGWGGPAYGFAPSVFLDVDAFIDRKLQALACYESQLIPPPHPRSLEGVRSNAASWGAYAGCAFAEPYECLRWVLHLPTDSSDRSTP
ncbi:MAG TPA: PIG-L family deacetylase [Longimicrobium sp.]|jgi:LmbE family N-acetylglucosaminyl deacetylase|nr:PIG-L family deacetylase [Longimicrobium sp.]